jgi:hypothetical protein
LTVLLPALVLALFGTMLWLRLWAEPPMPPVQPVVVQPDPATPTAGSLTGEVTRGPNATGDLVVANGDHSGGRSPAEAAAPIDESASLEVRVVEGPAGDASARPLPFVEVWLQLDGGWRSYGRNDDAMSALSDAQGKLRFKVARARGRSARLSSALGGAVELTLAPGDNSAVLPIEPKIVIVGEVVDPDGRGVAADLLALPLPTSMLQPARRVGRSAADGSFRFVSASDAALSAQHSAFGPATPMTIRVSGPLPTPVVPVRLQLQAAMAHLRGQVIDSDGQPLPGSNLEFDPSDHDGARGSLRQRGLPQRVHTDADGRFVVHHLAPGKVHYRARRAGFGLAHGVVTVATGDSPPLVVQLTAAASVFGVARDADGEALAQVIVEAGPIHARFAGTTSDRDGRFELRDLGPGALALRAVFATSASDLRIVDQTVEVAAGQAFEWNPVLIAGAGGGMLTGRLHDVDQAPLPEWKVLARPPRGIGFHGSTDANGAFQLPQAQLGPTFDLSVFAPGRGFEHFADAVFPRVAAAAAPFLLQVPPPRFGSVAVRVVDEQQRPLSVRARLRHAMRNEAVRQTAGDDGALQFREVPPGKLELQLDHPQQATLWQSIELDPNFDLDLGTLVMGRGARLHGSVKGPDGRAPAECQVTLFAGEQTLVGSYLGGHYEITGIPRGGLQLQVQATGCVSASWPIELGVGEDREQELVLRAGVPRTLAVEVPKHGGELVNLVLRPKDGFAQWRTQSSVVRPSLTADGTAVAEAWMAPGEYELLAWTAAGHEARATVAFAVGDTSEFRVRLLPK